MRVVHTTTLPRTLVLACNTDDAPAAHDPSQYLATEPIGGGWYDLRLAGCTYTEDAGIAKQTITYDELGRIVSPTRTRSRGGRSAPSPNARLAARAPSADVRR